MHKQSGVVLLIIAIVMALAALTYFLTSVSPEELRNDEKLKTARVLKQAKEALIAFALTDSDINDERGNIGKLPCPDYKAAATVEGVQDSDCKPAYQNVVGYFPWREIGIDVLRDSSGTCLLYAVSPSYKATPAAALNPDSYGQFQIVDGAGAVVQGDRPETRPVAVIFAPGNALSGQARNNNDTTICGFDYNNIAAYLDNDGTTDNSVIPVADNTIDKIVQRYTGSESVANPLNDRLITISHSDIWGPLLKKLERDNYFVANGGMYQLTEVLAMCVAGFGIDNSNHLPMPALINLNGDDYRRDLDYADSGNFNAAYAGRFPYKIDNAVAELVSGDDVELFKNGYCNGLNPSGPWNNVNLSDDNGDDKGLFRNLWRNWKDHFFFAVSKSFNPNEAATGCAAGCVRVDVTDYAGIVFFAGLKQGAQQRYSPPLDAAFTNDAIDDKDEAINYLEEGRGGLFPDNVGAGVYPVITGASNDIMFCINTDMSVTAC